MNEALEILKKVLPAELKGIRGIFCKEKTPRSTKAREGW